MSNTVKQILEDDVKQTAGLVFISDGSPGPEKMNLALAQRRKYMDTLKAVDKALTLYGYPDETIYEDDFNKGYCAGRKALRALVAGALEEGLAE